MPRLAHSQLTLTLTLTLALLLAPWLWPVAAEAVSGPLDLGVTPGPHAVGWRATVIADPSRGYRDELAGVGRNQRPIFISVWYPADRPAGAGGGATLSQGAYLELAGVSGAGAFGKRLSRLGREIVAEEVLGKPESLLDRGEADLLAEYLRRPTLAVASAPPARGRFPLLLYHPGLASVYEENAPLLEHLASQGYVVVSSAFQGAAPHALRIDGDLDLSKCDLEFLIAQLRSDPQVDGDRIGVLGHSFGGISTLSFAMRNDLVGAVVSIDSTLDYKKVKELPLDERDYQTFREPERLTVPVLAFAQEEAKFALLRTFTSSERRLVGLAGMDHNSFLWHGVAGSLLRREPGAPGRLTGYRNIVRFTHAFLEATLKGSQESRAWLDGQRGRAGARSPWWQERLPAARPPLSITGLAHQVVTRGPGPGAGWLRQRATADRIESSDLSSIAITLADRGHDEEALAVARLNSELHSDDFDAFDTLGDQYGRTRRFPEARTAYRTALSRLAGAPLPAAMKDGLRRWLTTKLGRVEARLKGGS